MKEQRQRWIEAITKIVLFATNKISISDQEVCECVQTACIYNQIDNIDILGLVYEIQAMRKVARQRTSVL